MNQKLIAYYSQRGENYVDGCIQDLAVGNTEIAAGLVQMLTQAVAQTIADTTGGDLFEIVPTETYSSADLGWTDKNSRVSKEHDDPSLRNRAGGSPAAFPRIR